LLLSKTVLAALSLSAASAFAETPDPSGQFGEPRTATATRAQVEAELAIHRKAGVNPWSSSYNPLKSFRSEKTRNQVTADYLAERKTVSAMNGEDSGSAFIAARPSPLDSRSLAHQTARDTQY